MLAPKLKIVANLSCDHSKQVYLVYLNNNNKEVKGPTIEQAIDQLRDLDIWRSNPYPHVYLDILISHTLTF